MKPDRPSPVQALAKWFPHTAFRDRQKDALDRIWENKSTVVLMPTGAGKSLIYQLPIVALGGFALVISPLIALMRQQAESLEKMGATVLALGGMDARNAHEDLRIFPWKEKAGFMFVSPERLETDGYIEFLLKKHRKAISLVVIDEAHCISQWGYDFRPPYKAIPGFLDRVFGLGRWPTLLCLTATLDVHNQQEILTDFRLKTEDVLRSSNLLRQNLDLSFRTFSDSDSKLPELENLLKAHKKDKIIVYTHLKQNKKRGTRALAKHFRTLGYACAPFDADLPTGEKDQILTNFLKGDLAVVFATGAFGMGIDIPDIRGVVHYLLPESLEQYYQEVGRAGRDGKKAFGTLFYTSNNAKVRRDMIGKSQLSSAAIKNFWEGVCEAGESYLHTVNPWTEFQGKEDEHALFYALQRLGAIEVLARGPGRLNSYKPNGPRAAAFLERLRSATKAQLTAMAIRKLNLDAAATIQEFFQLYDEGELKLVSAPDKTLFFRSGSLSEDNVQAIVSDIGKKIELRLKNFEMFVEIVESGQDPTAALMERFG